jgi:hypothetical protein
MGVASPPSRSTKARVQGYDVEKNGGMADLCIARVDVPHLGQIPLYRICTTNAKLELGLNDFLARRFEVVPKYRDASIKLFVHISETCRAETRTYDSSQEGAVILVTLQTLLDGLIATGNTRTDFLGCALLQMTGGCNQCLLVPGSAGCRRRIEVLETDLREDDRNCKPNDSFNFVSLSGEIDLAPRTANQGCMRSPTANTRGSVAVVVIGNLQWHMCHNGCHWQTQISTKVKTNLILVLHPDLRLGAASVSDAFRRSVTVQTYRRSWLRLQV